MTVNKKDSNNKKKLSQKRDCPDGLNKLIFDVNTIPEKTVSRDYAEVLRENDFDAPDGSTREEIRDFILRQAKKTFDECFVNFSEPYKKMLLETSEAFALKNYPDYDKWNLQFAAFRFALDHYRYLYSLNSDLRAIAEFFSYLRRNDYQLVNESELVINSGETITLPSFNVQLKREGTIGKVHKGLSEAVIGVDLDRIRTCKICNRIFWAKRTESSTCSPQHYETLKKRRARALTDEEKAEKKAQREANRERNKKLKQLKEKKNGTL